MEKVVIIDSCMREESRTRRILEAIVALAGKSRRQTGWY